MSKKSILKDPMMSLVVGYRIIIWAICALQILTSIIPYMRPIYELRIWYAPLCILLSSGTIFLLLRLKATKIRDFGIDLTFYEIMIHGAYGISIAYGFVSIADSLRPLIKVVLLVVALMLIIRLIWPFKDTNGLPQEWPPCGLLGLFNHRQIKENCGSKKNSVLVFLIFINIVIYTVNYLDFLWGSATAITVIVGVITIWLYSDRLNTMVGATISSKNEALTALELLQLEINAIKAACLVIVANAPLGDSNGDLIWARISTEQLQVLDAMERLLPGYKNGFIAEIFSLCGKNLAPKFDFAAQNDALFFIEANLKPIKLGTAPAEC